MLKCVSTQVEIGKACARFRVEVLRMSRKSVARQIGYSPSTIADFESGRNDNYNILIWYLINGACKQPHNPIRTRHYDVRGM